MKKIIEQGTRVDCVYCKYIRPELKGTDACPHCHGTSPIFKSMRMMDRASSSQEILYDILNMEFTENTKKMRQELLHLLTQIEVYDFNMKSALILYLQQNDE